MFEKKLIILRGLPGSGKSVVAKKLIENGCVGNGVIHSTDNFFMKDGKYVFDGSNLEKFHYLNFLDSIESMQAGKSPIIIDNTNVIADHCIDYVNVGRAYGYDIIVIEPNTSWAFDIDELIKRNIHEVSREVLTNMLEQYEKPEIFKKKLGLLKI